MNDHYSKNESGDITDKTSHDTTSTSNRPHAGLLDADGRPIPEIKHDDGMASNSKIADAASSISKWVVIWAAITAFATIAQAGIAWYSNYNTGKTQTEQFNQMKSVADRMEGAANSFAGNSANINQGIANATAKLQAQADAIEKARKTSEADSQNSLQATVDNFHQQQRAWVGLVGIEGVPTIGEKFIISPSYVNTGETPALHLRYGSRMILLDPNTPFSPDWNTGRDNRLADPSETTLFPKQLVSQHIRIARDPVTDDDIPLKQSDIDFVNQKSKLMYVFGRACYKDIFGTAHWLHYCSVYVPDSKTYFACGTFNEIETDKNRDAEQCQLQK